MNSLRPFLVSDIFHFFISKKGTHAPFFPKRLPDITSSQKILLLSQFSNNIPGNGARLIGTEQIWIQPNCF